VHNRLVVEKAGHWDKESFLVGHLYMDPVDYFHTVEEHLGMDLVGYYHIAEGYLHRKVYFEVVRIEEQHRMAQGQGLRYPKNCCVAVHIEELPAGGFVDSLRVARCHTEG
jgi:hypothetical protein